MKIPWGGALALPALHPAPPGQPMPSSAPGWEACRGTLHPQASCLTPGQEPVLPGMPGSSQRTLVPRGLGSPEILWTGE